MPSDLGYVIRKVLELSRRGIGLQGFQKALGLVQFGAQFLEFVLGQEVPAPEGQSVLKALLCEYDLLHLVDHSLLQFLNRLVLALCDELGHTRCQSKQLENCFERWDVPILGPLDVLELDQFIHAGPGQLHQPRSVELVPRNGKDDFS